jgi:hypothetical protein
VNALGAEIIFYLFRFPLYINQAFGLYLFVSKKPKRNLNPETKMTSIPALASNQEYRPFAIQHKATGNFFIAGRGFIGRVAEATRFSGWEQALRAIGSEWSARDFDLPRVCGGTAAVFTAIAGPNQI